MIQEKVSEQAVKTGRCYICGAAYSTAREAAACEMSGAPFYVRGSLYSTPSLPGKILMIQSAHIDTRDGRAHNSSALVQFYGADGVFQFNELTEEASFMDTDKISAVLERAVIARALELWSEARPLPVAFEIPESFLAAASSVLLDFYRMRLDPRSVRTFTDFKETLKKTAERWGGCVIATPRDIETDQLRVSDPARWVQRTGVAGEYNAFLRKSSKGIVVENQPIDSAEALWKTKPLVYLRGALKFAESGVKDIKKEVDIKERWQCIRDIRELVRKMEEPGDVIS